MNLGIMMTTTTDPVREAALLYSGDDAACTQTKVDLWPPAARHTIESLVAELAETEHLLAAARGELGDVKETLDTVSAHRCPKCEEGDDDGHSVAWPGPFMVHRRSCLDCGHEWDLPNLGVLELRKGIMEACDLCPPAEDHATFTPAQQMVGVLVRLLASSNLPKGVSKDSR